MTSSASPTPYKRDFPTAFGAIRKLLADGNDTTQVFVIMRSLNGPVSMRTATATNGSSVAIVM